MLNNYKKLHLYYFIKNKNKPNIYKTLFLNSSFIKFVPTLKKIEKKNLRTKIKYLKTLNLK